MERPHKQPKTIHIEANQLAAGRVKYVQNTIPVKLTSMAAGSGKELILPPTRKQVRACIDDADGSFGACWQTLTSLKKAAGLDGRALLDFQPVLASALFQLDDAYRRLVQYREILTFTEGAGIPTCWKWGPSGRLPPISRTIFVESYLFENLGGIHT